MTKPTHVVGERIRHPFTWAVLEAPECGFPGFDHRRKRAPRAKSLRRQQGPACVPKRIREIQLAWTTRRGNGIRHVVNETDEVNVEVVFKFDRGDMHYEQSPAQCERFALRSQTGHPGGADLFGRHVVPLSLRLPRRRQVVRQFGIFRPAGMRGSEYAVCVWRRRKSLADDDGGSMILGTSIRDPDGDTELFNQHLGFGYGHAGDGLKHHVFLTTVVMLTIKGPGRNTGTSPSNLAENCHFLVFHPCRRGAAAQAVLERAEPIGIVHFLCPVPMFRPGGGYAHGSHHVCGAYLRNTRRIAVML